MKNSMLLKVAFRNVFRQKRRSLLTLLTIFGGFTLSAFSIGWSDGSYSYIINMFTRNRLGHLQVHGKGYLDKPTLYNTIDDYYKEGRKIASVKGVEAWAPRVYSAGLASLGQKTAAAQIIGIDPELENGATWFDKKIISGAALDKEPSRKVLLGKGLAEMLKSNPTDRVVIISQASDGSIANDIYEVSGIVESGDEMNDRAAFYLHIKDAAELLVLENRAHEIAVIAGNIKDVKRLEKDIASALDNDRLSVEPWYVVSKSFYNAMKADVEGMWVMLFVIIMIVAVGVLNTILMSVLERRREYGLLKSLGTGPKQVFLLVMYEVYILSFVSIILGTAAGLALNYYFSFNGISLNTAFTYGGVEFSAMYTEINARSFYIPAIAVLFTAGIVGIFPSLRAAKVDPAKAMRTH
ncbi:MAG: FtsX-like permease family protein [Elusimicrobiota bacterium]